MSRMVQCPRCRAILQEPPPGNPYYKCGSCLTVLQAKHSIDGVGPRHPMGEDLPRSDSYGRESTPPRLGGTPPRLGSTPPRLGPLSKPEIRHRFSALASELPLSNLESSFARQKTMPNRVTLTNVTSEGTLEVRDPEGKPSDAESDDSGNNLKRLHTLPPRLPHASRDGKPLGMPPPKVKTAPSAADRVQNGDDSQKDEDEESDFQRQFTMPTIKRSESHGREREEELEEIDFRRQMTMPEQLGKRSSPIELVRQATAGHAAAALEPSEVSYALGSPRIVSPQYGDFLPRQRTMPLRGSVENEVEYDVGGNDDFRRQTTMPTKQSGVGFSFLRKDRGVKLKQETQIASKFRALLEKKQTGPLPPKLPGQLQAAGGGLAPGVKSRFDQSSSKRQSPKSPREFDASGAGYVQPLSPPQITPISSNSVSPTRSLSPSPYDYERSNHGWGVVDGGWRVLSPELSPTGSWGDGREFGMRMSLPSIGYEEGSEGRRGVQGGGGIVRGSGGGRANGGGDGVALRGSCDSDEIRRMGRIARQVAGGGREGSRSDLLEASSQKSTSVGSQDEIAGPKALRTPQKRGKNLSSSSGQDLNISNLPVLPPPNEPQVVWCQHCTQMLEVPEKVRHAKKPKAVQKLRCGRCMQVSAFAISSLSVENLFSGSPEHVSPSVISRSRSSSPSTTIHHSGFLKGKGGGKRFSSYGGEEGDLGMGVNTQKGGGSVSDSEFVPMFQNGLNGVHGEKSPLSRPSPCSRLSPRSDASVVSHRGNGNSYLTDEEEMDRMDRIGGSSSSSSSAAAAAARKNNLFDDVEDYPRSGRRWEGEMGGGGKTGRRRYSSQEGQYGSTLDAEDDKYDDYAEFEGPRENYQRCVTVNGKRIPDILVEQAEEKAGPIQPGEYWYDMRAGFWGVMGGECLGIIPPYIREFGEPMPRDSSGGRTRVLINGRALHRKDLELLVVRGLPDMPEKSYILDISGRVLDAFSGALVVSLGKLAPSLEARRRGSGMYVPPYIQS